LAIQFELVAQMEHVPEVREAFATANRQARLGLAELFSGLDPAKDPQKAMAVGSFYQALGGMAAQWLVDPQGAPSARDLTEALRQITADLSEPE